MSFVLVRIAMLSRYHVPTKLTNSPTGGIVTKPISRSRMITMERMAGHVSYSERMVAVAALKVMMS
jgi:hypothetical protein